jgi:PAS domain S-box-containing protein
MSEVAAGGGSDRPDEGDQMIPSFRVAFTAVLLATAGVTGALAVFAYRHREIPGSLPFAALAASLTHWALLYAIAIQVTDPFWRITLLKIQWVAHPTIPLWLLFFALQYTGHDEVLTRKTMPAIAAVPVLVVVGVWTNPLHHLLWTEQAIHVVDGMAVLVPTYGPAFWVNIVYGYGIETVAIALLLRLIYESEYLYADQSVLLFVGIVVPFIANVHEIFVVGSTPAVDYTPIAFAISGLAFGYAVFRRELFELIPATRTIGRSKAISQLDTGVVIVDDDRRIIYCNTAAGEILGYDPAETLGERARALVDEGAISFETEDALAETELNDGVYEIRTSPITDRHDRLIGHTLVIHDVTARTRREEELATVRDLNSVIRGVNQALVSAASREEIEQAVCDRLAGSDLYEGVCVADLGTWAGEADRWRIAGEALTDEAPTPPDGGLGTAPPTLDPADIRETDDLAEPTWGPQPTGSETDANWIVVPVVYGRTVYGAIGLVTDRAEVSDEERDVLGELGELVGHAISAVESRQLFGSEGVVELSVAVNGRDDPLAAATDDGTRLDIVGIVPRSGEGHHAFLRVSGASPEAVREHLASAGVDATLVGDGDDEGLLDVQIDESLSLSPIVTSEAHFVGGTAADGQVTYEVFVPSNAEGRTLLDRLTESFPSTDLRSKHRREHPFEQVDSVTPERLESLTDRQRESLEAAFRAGYFEWPREADAEEVAESMDITSPTLHSHLRKAQRTLLEELYADENAE